MSIPIVSAKAKPILDSLPSAAHARIRQSSYEREDQRIYSVDLICNDFARLAQASVNKLNVRLTEPGKEFADAYIPY